MKYEILRKIGSGSAGDGYLLKNGKAMIVGKREDSFSTYKALCEKMQILGDSITEVKYPKIYELISPCEEYPYGALIEEYIEGQELREEIGNLSTQQKEEIGKVLAKFVSQIHNIKTTDRKKEEIEINLSKLNKGLSIVKDYLPTEVYEKLLAIKEPYKNLLESKNFCLTHGDLNAGNIMIDKDGRVSGVIDFGNMEYYIPEIEFVHMCFFDDVIYDSMVKNYPKDISKKEIIFLELVVNIRHFKNIKDFADRRDNCLNNIKALLKAYLN